MIGFDQIDLRKTDATGHAVIEGLHVGQGVPVGHCDSVEVAEVASGAPGTVLLGHQMQGRCPGRVGLANNTCFLECKDLLFSNTVLLQIRPPGASKNRSCATCVDVVEDTVKGFGCCRAETAATLGIP
jgi:hypothetical protein